jgi:glutaredoxin
MWKRTFTLLLFLAAHIGTASAEIYKWTDANGNVHFSDRAPKSVSSETVNLKINTFKSVTIEPFQPFESKPIRRAGNVVMYSASWCGVCKRAKRYFQAKGIPFEEYDVEKTEKGKNDYAKLHGRGVPIILVGGKRMNGFSKAHFEMLYGK